ncbi:MAG TPA: beta-ketoacyl synthase N-terminal-like domain-containing protein [Methylomirabilota bacterium]|jgi:hypothetical protein|nr:beta-ketoacyl synthase N-terminal-like domain-containing protein [Methylomirabilota bacterium]
MRAPTVRALGWLSAGAHLLSAGEQPTGGDRVLSLGRPASSDERLRRSTRECLLAVAAVRAMLEDARADVDAIAGERTGLLYATAAGYGASNRGFIEGGGGIHFAYTAPAVIPAEVAIRFGVTGPYGIFLGGPPATLRAIWQAAIWLESGACDRALVLAVETFEECADLYARAGRLLRWPLVETAGCLWLEAGGGRLLFESTRGRGHRRASAGDGGERFSCQPLATLHRWRQGDGSEPLELDGAWRGEQARLRWTVGAPELRG